MTKTTTIITMTMMMMTTTPHLTAGRESTHSANWLVCHANLFLITYFARKITVKFKSKYNIDSQRKINSNMSSTNGSHSTLASMCLKCITFLLFPIKLLKTSVCFQAQIHQLNQRWQKIICQSTGITTNAQIKMPRKYISVMFRKWIAIMPSFYPHSNWGFS